MYFITNFRSVIVRQLQFSYRAVKYSTLPAVEPSGSRDWLQTTDRGGEHMGGFCLFSYVITLQRSDLGNCYTQRRYYVTLMTYYVVYIPIETYNILCQHMHLYCVSFLCSVCILYLQPLNMIVKQQYSFRCNICMYVIDVHVNTYTNRI